MYVCQLVIMLACISTAGCHSELLRVRGRGDCGGTVVSACIQVETASWKMTHPPAQLRSMTASVMVWMMVVSCIHHSSHRSTLMTRSLHIQLLHLVFMSLIVSLETHIAGSTCEQDTPQQEVQMICGSDLGWNPDKHWQLL